MARNWGKFRVKADLDMGKLQWVKGTARELIAERIEQAAERIKQEAKRRCPKRTGRTARSIDKIQEGELSWVVTHGIGDPERGPVGMFLELGTRYMSPRPHLGPALEAEKPELIKDIETVFKMMR